MSTFNPNHESTRKGWEAVVQNLTNRAARGLWGSRAIAVSLARSQGNLTTKRAEDLIRSAIKHGYLEERPSPLGAGHTTQVRLTDRDQSVVASRVGVPS